MAVAGAPRPSPLADPFILTPKPPPPARYLAPSHGMEKGKRSGDGGEGEKLNLGSVGSYRVLTCSRSLPK